MATLRRKWQFSLRTLVIATMLCGVAFGFWRAYVQPRLATIERVHFKLWYVMLEGKPQHVTWPGGAEGVKLSFVYVTIFHVAFWILLAVWPPLLLFRELDARRSKEVGTKTSS